MSPQKEAGARVDTNISARLEYNQPLIDANSLHRLTRLDDIADIIELLASHLFSYVTGRAIKVTGSTIQ